jgi:hypothetical protein
MPDATGTARPRRTAPPLAIAGAPGAGEIMPPFVLPGEHFAAALLWLALGGAGLVYVARDLAAGGFLAPRVIAVTHCFTLGWITTSVFGALYQLFPVILGVSTKSIALGHVTFALLQAGAVLLVGGTWVWRPLAMGFGWLLVLAALALQGWNVVARRSGATRGQRIGRYVMAGHVGFGLALLVAGERIGEVLGFWRVDRIAHLSAHAHLAVVAFATMIVVGVGSRLLPMFLLSRGHAEWPLGGIGPLAFGGAIGFALGSGLDVPAMRIAGGLAMGAGLALYLFLAAQYFGRRTRRGFDLAMAHVAAAHAFLGAAVIAGLMQLGSAGFSARVATAYGVLGVLGWLSLFIVGISYKILPFLTWMHRFSSRVGEPGVPKVADLTVHAFAWGSLALTTIGTGLLSVGIGAGSGAAAGAGAITAALGLWLVVAHHARLVLVQQDRRS